MKIRITEDKEVKEVGLKNTEGTSINKQTVYENYSIPELKDAKKKLEAVKELYSSGNVEKIESEVDENKRKL